MDEVQSLRLQLRNVSDVGRVQREAFQQQQQLLLRDNQAPVSQRIQLDRQVLAEDGEPQFNEFYEEPMPTRKARRRVRDRVVGKRMRVEMPPELRAQSIVPSHVSEL